MLTATSVSCQHFFLDKHFLLLHLLDFLRIKNILILKKAHTHRQIKSRKMKQKWRQHDLQRKLSNFFKNVTKKFLNKQETPSCFWHVDVVASRVEQHSHMTTVLCINVLCSTLCLQTYFNLNTTQRVSIGELILTLII